MESREVVGMWMSLVSEFTPCFTKPGQRRFAALLTGALLAGRRPLVSEIVTALGAENQWRAAEAFLEYGRWPLRQLEQTLAGAAAPLARWHGRGLWAVDDLKTLKDGKKIWGACSFHEYTSRSSNRPETVWAHNWVLCGALKVAGKKAFLPTAGRLYIRKSQLPGREAFRTKSELAVELLRACAKSSQGPHLAIFDGGYAVSTVVEPLIGASAGEPRIEFLSRLRFDARLYEPPPARRQGQRGRPRKWGRRLAAPRDAHLWPSPWREGEAKVYGKMRRIRYKQVPCQWHPAGAEARVHAFVFHVEGYKKPWHLVTSDLGLKPQEALELYAARFTQEDAHRDMKQQLGLGTGQGRLKNVVLRTLQLRLTAMTLLRMLAQRLQLAEGDAWWHKPPWYPQKQRGSLRDIKRVIVEARDHFSQLDWQRLTSEKPPRRDGAQVVERLNNQIPPCRAA
jgi:hypothetical protein